MNNELKAINQNVGEDDLDFTRRAVEAIKKENIKVLNFQDGLSIHTDAHDIDYIADPLAPNILYVEHNNLREDILEPLTILTEAAKKNIANSNYADKVQELEQKITKMEAEKAGKTKQLENEREQDRKNNFAQAEISRKIYYEQREKLLVSIKSNEEKIKDYLKDIEEQEKRLKEPAKELTEILQKFEAAKSNPRTTKEEMYVIMAKKERLEWEVEAYTEYIDFLKKETINLNNDKKTKVSELEKLKENNTKYHEIMQKEFENKYGKFHKIDGKLQLPSIEEAPILVTMNQEIEAQKAQLAYYKRDPEQIKQDFLQAVQKGASPKSLQPELDLLISILDGPTVTGVLDHQQYNTNADKLSTIQNQKQEVETRLDKNEYYQQSQMIRDQKIIENNKKEIEKMQAAIKNCDEQLKMYQMQKELKPSKERLRAVNKSIEINKEQKQFLSTYDSENARKYDDILKSLYREKQSLETKIENLTSQKRIYNSEKILRNKEIYISACNAYKAEIEELENCDYFDYEAKNNDEILLEKLNNSIQELENKQKFLGTHNAEDLKNQIISGSRTKTISSDELEEQIKETNSPDELEEQTEEIISPDELEEQIKETNLPDESEKNPENKKSENNLGEIESYKEIKPSLKDKIRNIHFIEKAKTAFANITSSLKFNHKKTIDLDNELEESLKKDVAPTSKPGTITSEEDVIRDIHQQPTLPNKSPGKIVAISPEGERTMIDLPEVTNYIEKGYNVVIDYYDYTEENNNNLGANSKTR